MHELSVAQRMLDVMESAAREGGAGKVRRARVVIGALTCIEPESLTLAFDVVTRGTSAEGCVLDIRRVPLRLRCRACGSEGAEDLLDPCGSCGALGHDVVEGRELRLESIEVEERPQGDAR